MGPNTILGKWIPFTSVKSTISLSNIDCVHMKMNPDLPKLKLRSTEYPTNTGKIFNAKNVTLKEEKPVKLAVGKKSLELFFETKSVKILKLKLFYSETGDKCQQPYKFIFTQVNRIF